MLLQALPNGIGMGKGIQTSSSSSLGLLPVLREVGDIVDKRRTTLSNDQHRGGGDAPTSKNNNSSMVSSSLESISAGGNGKEEPASLPLIVALNCLPDCRLEQEALAGVAVIEHVSLGQVAEGKIEAAAAVLVHSLAYLPRAAQRRLQPWQLILSLSCADKAVDSALANELGLQLVHVDSGRAEEIADTVMALLLGLLRHTHLLASQGYASGGWLGTIHASCRGMRRCRGMVLGIVGTSASAYAVAIRSLAFRMNVIYFDPLEKKGGGGQSNKVFPPGVKKVETLKDLLSASDMVTLHCALTNDTVQLINADSLQYIKQGVILLSLT
jgi:phosphoglycerate dehydrogenase-like enzyme